MKKKYWKGWMVLVKGNCLCKPSKELLSPVWGAFDGRGLIFATRAEAEKCQNVCVEKIVKVKITAT